MVLNLDPLVRSRTCVGAGAGEVAGDRGTEASEAVMASLVVLLLTAIAFGAPFGVFLKISFAIRREDRARNSLRFDAPNSSTRAARSSGHQQLQVGLDVERDQKSCLPSVGGQQAGP